MLVRSEEYPVNLVELFEAQRLGMIDEVAQRRKNRERHIDFQSAEMFAIGGLEQYCRPLPVAEEEAS